jgi:hypothetical protein
MTIGELKDRLKGWSDDFEIGLIPENWTVEKCSSAQVKGAEGNEEKSVQ